MWQVLLTIPISFVVISLFGYWTHRFLHSSMSGALYRSHMTHHLRLYPPSDYMSIDEYRDPGNDNTAHIFLMLGLPLLAVPVGLLLFHIIGWPVFITIAISTLIFGGLHNYLHDRFHIEKTWMRKYYWFQKLIWLHFIHHCEMGTNYGIYFFLFDRLFKTFRPKLI